MRLKEFFFIDLFLRYGRVKEQNLFQTSPLDQKLIIRNDETKTPKFKDLKELVQFVFFREFQSKTYLIFCFYIVESISRNILSIVMSLLINSVINKQGNSILYAFILILLSVVSNISRHQAITISMEFSAKSRFTLLKILYSKLLASTSISNANKIIGLATSDISMLEYYFMLIFQIFVMPISFLFGSIILCVRFNSLVGIMAVFIVALIYPLQITIQRLSIHYIKQYKAHQDERIKLISEFVDNIRIIKMYNIQKRMEQKIMKARKLEQSQLLKSQIVSLIDRTFSFFAQIWSSLIFFAILYYFNYDLTGSTMIATIQQLQYFKVNCVQQVSYGLQSYLNIKLIFTRYIETYNTFTDTKTNIQPSTDQCLLTIISRDSKLRLSIKPNDFIVISGKIGCGKTIFLLSLLNQAPASLQGDLQQSQNFTKSYVEQDPVLFQDTIRNNILFGRIYIEELYQRVLTTVCLDQDIKQMQNGDSTTINDRATTISGGQKTRIALARALYSLADLIVLDDPFSSLDIKIQRMILLNLKDFLSSYHISQTNKAPAVVLATHSESILNLFQQYYILDQGQLHLHNNEYFQNDHNILKQEIQQPIQKIEKEQQQQNPQQQHSCQEKIKISQNKVRYFFRLWNQNSTMSILMIIIIVLLNINSEILYNLYYRGISQFNSSNQLPLLYYLALVCLGAVINNLVKYNLNAYGCQTANDQIHHQMVESVSDSKIYFFDKNPSSLILTKCSTDLSTADNMIPVTLLDVWELGSYFLASLLSLALLYPQFILLMIIAVVLNYSIFYQYKDLILKSQEQDQQMKAPLLDLFKKTVQGVRTIQIFGQEKYFQNQFLNSINNSVRANTTYYYLQRLFAINIDLIGLFGQITGISVILVYNQSDSFVQAILLLMIFNDNQQWFLRQLLSLSTQLNSVNRMEDLINIEKESDSGQLNNFKKPHGNINLSNVFLKYGNDYALKGLNLKIQQGEKVGIVGRTGAGKSSIIAALFRLYEVESSDVLDIDGTNIREISLQDLRNSMSIIPQTPTIFNDSIRNNIDLLQQSTDEEIYIILKELNLYEYVMNQPNGLESKFTELSQGNKQLVSLSRILLQNRQIIVMDEATSSIDSNTDEFIQKILTQRLKDRTVITIAHKIETLRGYDKVIVVEDGKVIQECKPKDLLNN